MTRDEFLRVRRAARISQCRLGQLAGMQQTLVSQYERGTLVLHPTKLAALQRGLRHELRRAAREIRALAERFRAV